MSDAEYSKAGNFSLNIDGGSSTAGPGDKTSVMGSPSQAMHEGSTGYTMGGGTPYRTEGEAEHSLYIPSADEAGGESEAAPESHPQEEVPKRKVGKLAIGVGVAVVILGLVALFPSEISNLLFPTESPFAEQVPTAEPEHQAAPAVASPKPAAPVAKTEPAKQEKPSKPVAKATQESEDQELDDLLGDEDDDTVQLASDTPKSDPSEPDTVIQENVVQFNRNQLYTSLPNILPKQPDLERIWNAEEEEKWRNGLNSDFAWQHYKTVLEVKNARLAQSKVVLWDALTDPKLWVRMHALLGLASFGVPVSLTNLESALGNASKSLTKRFFMRFQTKASESEAYVLKLAMGIVEADSRIQILKALNANPSKSNQLFMVAGLNDPDPRVKNYAMRAVSAWPASDLKEAQADFKKAVNPTTQPTPPSH